MWFSHGSTAGSIYLANGQGPLSQSAGAICHRDDGLDRASCAANHSRIVWVGYDESFARLAGTSARLRLGARVIWHVARRITSADFYGGFIGSIGNAQDCWLLAARCGAGVGHFFLGEPACAHGGCFQCDQPPPAAPFSPLAFILLLQMSMMVLERLRWAVLAG